MILTLKWNKIRKYISLRISSCQSISFFLNNNLQYTYTNENRKIMKNDGKT